MGHNWYDNPFTFDVHATFSKEAALANNADTLIDRLPQLLTGGAISSELRGDLRELINLTPMSESGARTRRAKNAITALLTSPEYLVQK